MSLFLQIFVIGCFALIIIALFREQTDFLSYSMVATFAAAVATFWILPEEITVDELILSIEWDVIFFLISIFTIVEVLEDKHIFNEVALRITEKYQTNTRKFFWTICLISTLSAAFIEDVSVAIIFVPMIIATSDKLRINPTPILLGMTICINLAATLTPFGSSQNILIAVDFQLTSFWFFLSLGFYFIIATFLTLFLLDKFVLQKSLDDIWCIHCEELSEPMVREHYEEHELVIMEKHIDKKVFNKNLVALLIFVCVLFLIPNILFGGIFGMLMFIILNPRKISDGKKRVDISFYLSKVDYKLVFFFLCLFILIFCMEINGTLLFLENLVVSLSSDNLFLMCLFVLIATSILSGFLDNVPVTVLFIPIIQVLISEVGLAATPLLIAFILGINLGGNIFPQGAACDMLTLELAKKNNVEDLTYRKLLKIGGLFAILHIILGIAYLAVIVQFF